MTRLSMFSSRVNLLSQQNKQSYQEQSTEYISVGSTYEYPSEKTHADRRLTSRFNFAPQPVPPESIDAKLNALIPTILMDGHTHSDSGEHTSASYIYAGDAETSTVDTIALLTSSTRPLAASKSAVEVLHHRESTTSVVLSALCSRRSSKDSNNSAHSQSRHRLSSFLPTNAINRNATLTELMLSACCTGDLPLIGRLIGAGASVSKCTKDGTSPAHLAAANGHLNALKCLAMHGAKMDAIDVGGRTPLFVAILAGQKSVVPFLAVSVGAAGLRLRDSTGRTAMEYARLIALEDASPVEQCLCYDGENNKKNAETLASPASEIRSVNKNGLNHNALNKQQRVYSHGPIKDKRLSSLSSYWPVSSSSSSWNWQCRTMEEVLRSAAEDEGVRL